jgi:uncharacterized protein with PIN domain
VNVYAESSAVLAWLLGEEDGQRVREVLRRSEFVAASDLTLIECDRVLIRAVVLGEIDEAKAVDGRADLNAAAAHWHVWRLSADIAYRARRPFPKGTYWRSRCHSLGVDAGGTFRRPRAELLSLDDRIRRSDEELGFRLQPKRRTQASRQVKRCPFLALFVQQ